MLAAAQLYPAKTAGHGGELAEYTMSADGYKEFVVNVEVVDWEVEPGKIVKAWTYNGTVPGPWIRVEPGDKVEVVLRNELPISTDIHWHGISTPFGQDGVAPLTQPMSQLAMTLGRRRVKALS